jgi:pimeloyl-ACP methyl ester carboxylesterase
MPYFADRGHDTFAISFRFQGKSDRQLGVKSAGTLGSHAADLDHFISTLDQRPVIIAHSLSGLIAQRYLC